jgi:hypothetical protein
MAEGAGGAHGNIEYIYVDQTEVRDGEVLSFAVPERE